MKHDPVNHPIHYCSHPSHVECILITEHMSFNVGNSFKYLYRCTAKGYTLNDLLKAKWYLERELGLRKGYWFQWFSEDENYNARFDGSPEIQTILTYESRFGGWMCQALERLYTASVQKRGLWALDHTLTCVDKMIRIQENREGRVV